MQTMTIQSIRNTLVLLLTTSFLFSSTILHAANGRKLKAEAVLKSIKKGQQYLRSKQEVDGSWRTNKNGAPVGVTSMAVMALINSGLSKDAPSVKKGLRYLRQAEKELVNSRAETYETSLLIMALATAKDGKKDKPFISRLARKLEQGQILRGPNAGSWGYRLDNRGGGSGDRSNGQFAVLGLRDASHMGVFIQQSTWKRARKHWLVSQNRDGGWGYSGLTGQRSRGSLTCAGIASLVITQRMIVKNLKKEMTSDGKPNCCGKHKKNKALERGIRCMGRHFQKGTNWGENGWLLYYLYAMERAGRLSGRRFFGKHDWYREVAEYLLGQQSPNAGFWIGTGGFEKANPVASTCFALLFLSKGLSPVLINKLKYGPRVKGKVNKTDWNQHRNDARNLTEYISTRKGWPKLLTWQMLDMKKIEASNNLEEMLQAPVLMITGRKAPVFSDTEILLLRKYVELGGFIFAIRNCEEEGFDKGIREVVRRMYPNDNDAKLKRLTAEHPIYRSEHLLNAETIPLYGVDFGCRTSIVYCPEDISCLWEKWMRQDPAKRPLKLKGMITRATRIGVNVIAYATGREPANKLTQKDLGNEKGTQDKIKRGLLQIAKLRHPGGWDTAPRALRNLLIALNKAAGMTASTQQKNLPATDPNLFHYPILYMHGRHEFSMSQKEKKRLREYLDQGGVLFSDSCCGAKKYDKAFRQLMKEIYPNKKFKRIPANHEMFTKKIGYDIRKVKRRAPEISSRKTALNTRVKVVEPYLEGIETNGRFAVIYSKYDISCALERQASVACAGYIPKDATRIAINIILYAMLQDITYSKLLEKP